MASAREVKFTEVDIKSFTKKQKNTNMKKEPSYDLIKTIQGVSCKVDQREIFLKKSSRQAARVYILKVCAFDSHESVLSKI